MRAEEREEAIIIPINAKRDRDRETTLLPRLDSKEEVVVAMEKNVPRFPSFFDCVSKS
jgi:hypothetical protein